MSLLTFLHVLMHKVLSFHEQAGNWFVLLQVCPETSLSDLIKIFSNNFFKYSFKRKLILPRMKNPQGKTIEIPFSPLKKSSLFSSLSVVPPSKQSPSS